MCLFETNIESKDFQENVQLLKIASNFGCFKETVFHNNKNLDYPS